MVKLSKQSGQSSAHFKDSNWNRGRMSRVVPNLNPNQKILQINSNTNNNNNKAHHLLMKKTHFGLWLKIMITCLMITKMAWLNGLYFTLNFHMMNIIKIASSHSQLSCLVHFTTLREISPYLQMATYYTQLLPITWDKPLKIGFTSRKHLSIKCSVLIGRQMK